MCLPEKDLIVHKQGMKDEFTSVCFFSTECYGNTSPPLSPYSDCAASSLPSHKEASPPLTPYSDIERTSGDCDSEKRKRQRFSPIEVWELERAFRRRPYLLKEDEEELVQRLGITAKSLKVSFYHS